MFLSITVDSVVKNINVYEIQTFKPIDDESGKYIYYVLRNGVTYNEYFDSDSDRQAKLSAVAAMNPVQDCVDDAISQLDITDREIVDELPTQDISTKTIYMVPQVSPGQDDFYLEYMYINNEWEIIGKTTVDMSNYLAKDNTVAFTPSGDYNPATKKYVDEKSVPYQPFPSGIVTDSTTPTMISSIQSLNLPSGSTYLGEVTLTDMPFQGNAEVEVYVYPDNVIYLVLRSVNVSPYIWQCNSHTYRGWESLGGGDIVCIGDISNLTTSSTVQQIYNAFGGQETYNKFLDCIQEGIPVYMYKSSSFGPRGSGRNADFIPIIKTTYQKSPMSSSGAFTVIFPVSALDSSAVVSFGIKRFSFDSTGPIVTASSYSDSVRKTYMIDYGIDDLTSNSTSSDISSVINLKEILDLTQFNGILNYFNLNYKFIDNSYAPASLYNIIGLFVESWAPSSDYRYIIQYMKGADKLVTLTLSSDTSGTENSYAFVSKTEVDLSNSAGSSVDVQINGTSIVSNDVANILTNTAYDSSTNKIATMSDIASAIGTALNQSY